MYIYNILYLYDEKGLRRNFELNFTMCTQKIVKWLRKKKKMEFIEQLFIITTLLVNFFVFPNSSTEHTTSDYIDIR